MTSPCRPSGLSLANWRQTPFSRWSFQHVRDVIPTARIKGSCASSPTRSSGPSLVESGFDWLLPFLTETETDSLLVFKDGDRRVSWSAPDCDASEPHLLFSVSKSITGLLAGVLVERGLLDCARRVTDYLPELAGSAYGDDCTIRHLLDMTVSLDFDEDYLDPLSAFARYRRAMQWNPPASLDDTSNLLSFAASLMRRPHPHGEKFFYASPNSDVLGALLARVAKQPFETLLSEAIWAPLAAQDAYVTVDRNGNPRSAGGICVTIDDLARLGELVRQGGRRSGHQIVPADWIADLWTGGSRAAWLNGWPMATLPNTRYRSQWYAIGDADDCLCAIGIHGQWIYINPKRGVVIAKTSAQTLPVDDEIDRRCLSTFDSIARQLA